jgi:hypothetical protein
MTVYRSRRRRSGISAKRFVSCTIVLLLSLLAGAAPSAGGVGRSAATCRSGHPFLITADDQAQVFTKSLLGQATPYAYACAYGHLTFRLGLDAESIETSGDESELAPGQYAAYRLAGTVLAYENFHPWPSGADYTGARFIVMVRDLRTGHVLHQMPSGTAPKHARYVGSGETENIVVKSNGAVAWIARDLAREEASKSEYKEIRAVDRSGSRLLAAGPNIASGSLTLVGSTLYWTQGGHTHTATLR